MLHTLRRWLKRWLPQVGQTSKKEQESEQEENDLSWEWFDFLRGPGYSARDERPSKDQKPEQPPLEMIEYEIGWPPPVNTD
jgi:hypothetical protein